MTDLERNKRIVVDYYQTAFAGDPEKAEGYFHASWGWIIFVISLVMLYALHNLMSMILEKAGAKE